jgi:hypothetical protein
VFLPKPLKRTSKQPEKEQPSHENPSKHGEISNHDFKIRRAHSEAEVFGSQGRYLLDKRISEVQGAPLYNF